jgi:hypothetical protein
LEERRIDHVCRFTRDRVLRAIRDMTTSIMAASGTAAPSKTLSRGHVVC